MVFISARQAVSPDGDHIDPLALMCRLHKHRTALTQVKGLKPNRRHFVLNKLVSLRGTVPRHTARWETHSSPCGNDLLLPTWSSSGKHSLSWSGGSRSYFGQETNKLGLDWVKRKPTWCHLFYYLFNTHSMLNMFRPLIRPSSGVCD